MIQSKRSERRPTTDAEQGAWMAFWDVAAEGYRWIKAEGELHLVEAQTEGRVGMSFDMQRYTPLRAARPIHRALWRLYRDNEPGPALPNVIRQFARRYGLLGLERTALPGSEPGPVRAGERLADWRNAIEMIGRTVDLFDMVQEPDRSRLRQHIVWRAQQSPRLLVWHVEDQWGHWSAPIAGEELHPEVYRHWSEDEVLEPGRFALAEHVNERLRDATRPVLMPLRASSVRFAMRGALRPDSLLAVGYLELYLALTGQRRYRPCEAPNCGEWIDTTDTRSDKRYCNEAHKKRGQRQRNPKPLRGTAS